MIHFIEQWEKMFNGERPKEENVEIYHKISQ